MQPSLTLSASRYEFCEKAVRDLRSKVATSVAFDIGTGDGRMRKPIEAGGYTWRGFDLEPQNADTTAWDLNRPCPSNERAAVVSFLDVIEHLVNPGLALTHIAQALEPGGYLILTTPNPRWSRSRIAALVSGYPACFTQSDLVFNNHVFPVWPHILKKMLSDAGFEITEYVTLDGPSAWPDKPLSLRYPLRCGRAIVNKTIEWFDRSACGMSYGVIARSTAG